MPDFAAWQCSAKPLSRRQAYALTDKCRESGKQRPAPLIARAVHRRREVRAIPPAAKSPAGRIAREGAKRLRPIQENPMPKIIYSKGQRGQSEPSKREEELDPLQELVFDPEDGELTEDEREAMGDLGNAGDEAEMRRVAGLIEDIETRDLTRLSYVMYSVENSIKELFALRWSFEPECKPEPISVAHWRSLADEALGLLTDEARRELDEQRLMRSMPQERRASFQQLCDSRRGIAVFHKAFEEQRAAWEKAYWRRALDESFGKRPWTGPSGEGPNA